VTGPAPKQESDAAALIAVAASTRVDPPPPPAKSLAPDATEVEKTIVGVGHDAEEGSRLVKRAREIPSGELIVPSPPASTFLLEVRLSTAGEVAGTS
jgi:hypothetical protein